MSYKRRKVVNALEHYGFFVEREGSNHTIYSDGKGKRVPVGRHREIDKEIGMKIAREIGISWEELKAKIS